MKNKYQHIIDTITKDNINKTVGKPKSNWRYKVYPKPKIWITKETKKYGSRR